MATRKYRITTTNTDVVMGDPFIADSKAQLQKLINETFNL